MPFTSEILDYDPEWSLRFTKEQYNLSLYFGSKLLRIEHVSSTAVPELSAKPARAQAERANYKLKGARSLMAPMWTYYVFLQNSIVYI